MDSDLYVAEPFGTAGNVGRRLREIYGEAPGAIDDRMLDLLRQLDAIPSSPASKQID